jgi:hypothetical protein
MRASSTPFKLVTGKGADAAGELKPSLSPVVD